MALYHCSIKNGSRATGQSAVAKADYILREDKYAQNPNELVAGWAGNLPSWTKGDARAFWSAADAHTRANGRLFTEIECALPIELTPAQQLELVKEFAADISKQGGGLAPYVCGIHNNDGNPHFHLEMSSRADDGRDRIDGKTWFSRAATGKKAVEDGGCKSWAETTDKVWLQNARERWAEFANKALEKAGSTARVDHRSLVDQGIDRIPTLHVGYGASAAKRAAQNEQINALNRELEDALKARAALAAQELIDEATAAAILDVSRASVDEDAPVSFAGFDIAAAALTPTEIVALKKEIAPPARTIDELTRELAETEKTIAEARRMLPDTMSTADIATAKKSLPAATDDVQRAAKELTRIEDALLKVKWYQLFKKWQLENALPDAQAASRAAREHEQETRITATAADRAATYAAQMKAQEQANTLRAAIAAIPATQQRALEQDAISKLLLADAAKSAAKAADNKAQ